MNKIKQYQLEHPLSFVLFIGLIIRLVSVIFSKGYGMFDDHFLVIEAAQSWVDGEDYNNWLPGSPGNSGPQGHSFFYVGLHFLLFHLMELFGIFSPETKMFLIRTLHAFYSLLVIYFGYKLALRFSDQKTAYKTAMLLALLWFMPFLSVRNLVEIVCIPLLLWGTWIISQNKQKINWKSALYAGFILGLAFSVRFQTIFFTAGIGLVLFIRKQWWQSILFGGGLIMSIFLIQGIIDWIIWDYPFAEFYAYVSYNWNHAQEYIVSPWYTYLLLILGIFIPPLSIMLLWGYIRYWKKYLLLFLPSLIFLVFHSYFPNKQERFIFPIVPFIIVMGMIGWEEFIKSSAFWKKRKTLIRSSWIFFWTLNLLVLPVTSTAYSKRAQVESMKYLSQYKAKINSIVLEDSNNSNVSILPEFYLEKWVYVHIISSEKPIGSINAQEENPNFPQFILFFGEKNINNRIENAKKFFPLMEFEAEIKPGFIDSLVHWLNPVNANQTIYIYKTK